MLARAAIAPGRRRQAAILTAFLSFQGLDAITTHIGLQGQHQEMNRIMGPVIALHGELAGYAIKGIAVAVLLAILMLLQHRKPHVWGAYHVAAWVSAAAVMANVIQLI